MEFRKFRGTDKYLTSSALESAVNCALALERPLLVRGEPGTGKTQLAEAIASASCVFPVPGSPRTSSGRSSASAQLTADSSADEVRY